MRTTSAVAIRRIMMACGPVTRKQKRLKRGRAFRAGAQSGSGQVGASKTPQEERGRLGAG